MTDEAASAPGGRSGSRDDELKRKQLSFTNTLLFETPGGVRFTQDSPILPNVWLAFAIEPREQQELILTTHNDFGAGQAAQQLREDLASLRRKRPTVGDDDKDPKPRNRARVSYIPGQIAVKLYFDELMRVVLPLTSWWHTSYNRLAAMQRSLPDSADWTPFPQPDHHHRDGQEIGKREQDLLDALMIMRREIDSSGALFGEGDPAFAASGGRREYLRELPPSLVWLVRIAGLIGDSFATGIDLLATDDSLSSQMALDFEARRHDRIETTAEREQRVEERRVSREKARATRNGIVHAFTHLYDEWVLDDEDYPDKGFLWRVTKNRRVHLAVAKSALTVKADAARSLFDISCQRLTWAVLDSGIDGSHPAFRLTTAEHEKKRRRELKDELVDDKLPVSKLASRVKTTLDFTYLRELLDYGIDDDDKADERHQALLRKIACRMSESPCACRRGGECNPSEDEVEQAKPVLSALRLRISEGKEIDWEDLESAIVATNPPPPTNDHGTHVAGILGADWIEDFDHEADLPLTQRTRRMTGICPDINLIDVRVFREDGLTDEFELLAAIQYLRWMNSRAGTMQVHGANLSLSLIHEVRRFACGQTPICDECNEAVALGMVIVAAAGNRGFEMTDEDVIRSSDSYRSVSITDPGNAESVITVGATHRKRPHEYGVSYFSSRGPTGDGRLKPDLVAPGEKIKGPIPGGSAETKDGTSMAAPHVSGAAALLMARHGEMIGRPDRIKEILCDTATDLGRERYFQGHGLVDALRALQSL